MRVLHPHPGIIGFYDGRIDGRRLASPKPNWLDDGAYSLGVCSYVIHDGACALVFDTHISVGHAWKIREMLTAMGIEDIFVVLSHHHNDHIAGNEVFSDCRVISGRRTSDALSNKRTEIELAFPPINPVVMPNIVFEGSLQVKVGSFNVEVIPYQIHSEDCHVLWLQDQKLLLSGDTLEDPIPYVAEPAYLQKHRMELERLSQLPVKKILPSHGSETVISEGGFDKRLIQITSAYLEKLLTCKTDATLSNLSLKQFAAFLFESGIVTYQREYEKVHRDNVAVVLDCVS